MTEDLIPMVMFISIAVVFVFWFYFRHRGRMEMQQTFRMALEKGTELTPELIRQMGELVISDRKDFQKAVLKYRHKRSVVVLVQRGEQGYYLTVKLR